MNSRPKPPPTLQKTGKKLWAAVLADAPEHIVLDARDRSILAAACAQGDLNADLEEALREAGLTIRGAAGQWRMNAAATELRQGRLALAKLLGQVRLDRAQAPVEEDEDWPPSWAVEEYR